ncbi:MAG TPA: ABC transporter permease [Candidatus Limnocylindrales bacterium]|nr:ABC transporter permease [Candidatus Limnocylindrales bacterium]
MQWLKDLFTRGRHYRDLAVSIEEHLEERTEELMDEGMSREAAETVARREFGNVTLIQERSREVWQWPTLESIWADKRFALRQLIRAPGFTATAVLTLSLGIAVNATMFSMVSAFLLPHLPGRNPQNVVVVSSVSPHQRDANPVSPPNYLAWREDTRLFSEMAAADESRTASLTGDGEPETVRYATVSPNYFEVFGVSAALGRTFRAGEDEPGRDHVLILSHALWERRFGAERSAIGRTVRVNRENYVVVGVMPADFQLLGFAPQMWTPLVFSAANRTVEGRKQRFLFLFARLAHGITLQRAQAEMAVLAKHSETDFPAMESRWSAAVRTLGDFLIHSFGIRTALAVLMTAVSFVLLIACANVAGLLLTRAAGRRKELAIRVSLGASRVRVVRQLVTEGLVIAILGGGTGLLLTDIGIKILRANLSFNEAISAVPVSLDVNVLLFVLVVSLISATLSSLVPALKASHTDTNTGLKNESRTSSAGRSQGRLRTALVCGEIAFGLCLLIGTSLLIRGVFLLDHQKLGFSTDHLLTAAVALDRAQYSDGSHQLLFVRGLIRKLQQIPGAGDTAVASDLPATNPETVPIHIEGEADSRAGEQYSALDTVVSPGYFHAIRLPPLRGRTFRETDGENAPRVVLVNQEFANRYFQGRDPLGKRIQLDLQGAALPWGEIVGVVSNVKSYSEDARVDPEVYECFLQRPTAYFSILLRASAEPDSLSSALRHAVSQLDPELPLARVMSMQTVIERQRNGNPLFIRLLGTFGLLALVLAATGIYGLIAYSVSQRTHEIGIRVALGANRSDVLRMILSEGFRTAVIGSAIGLAMALPLPKLFDAIFAGLHFGAPEIYLIVLSAVLVVTAFAAYIPARRATYIDPTLALRDQ